MTRKIIAISIAFFLVVHAFAQPRPEDGLTFDSLAKKWDQAIPLGNGWLGALIWEKDSLVRISLDRVDLWDDRPMPDIDKLTFKWIVEQVQKNDYDTVQKLGDEPYEKYPAPTKIPGAALSFDLRRFGKVTGNELDILHALSTVKFENGVLFHNYIHATNKIGYFGFENLPKGNIFLKDIFPVLVIPAYHSGKNNSPGNSVEGQGLERLGYSPGTVTRTGNSILYHQPTWNGNYYEVLVKWKMFSATNLVGEWTIAVNAHAVLPELIPANKETTGWSTHLTWWKRFWQRSSISIPDKLLEKQYFLELYKFGCVARAHTPPISLQAIWTADNGNLPPWKGDIHNDLNTQLSYWPGYMSNHLDLTESYTNFLWRTKKENETWTKRCFAVAGLNVPGVTTISGKAMGGWIQYSLSPTTVCWLAQHFYWQWKYSMNKEFFHNRLRPYFNEVVTYLQNVLDKQTHQLPLSSSPEFNDNKISAWFKSFTNYDLALCKYVFGKENEIQRADSSPAERRKMLSLKDLPDFNTDETGLTVALGQDLDVSHRHMSPYMAIYPLCLLDIERPAEGELIKRSLRHLESLGTREWCGYSFSWMASLYARAKESDSAVRQLQIFATNFCSPNSFHLNGDQRGGQYSSFTYSPFTLEGNFAFAQGIHELLLQVHNDVVEIFPAVPRGWRNVSFHTLRTEGAFLVSANKENGETISVRVLSEHGGKLKIKLPFRSYTVNGIKRNEIVIKNDIATMNTAPGQTINFMNSPGN
jgi:alpha-L-fucosidase 2